MIYCINPECRQPQNLDTVKFCQDCGSELLLAGRYQVTNLLGKGGFAKTYEVWDGSTSKVLKVLLFESPKAVELFQQEARVLSRLNYPGIPKIDSTGYFLFYPRNSRQPLHCLVMEKIAGLNLEDWMQQRAFQPISEALAINWLRQLTLILDQVHRQQFFHRDIKPANIMLQPDGQLALIDFGSVREMTGTVIRGESMTQIVSAGYTPAEQIQGHAVPQSDFFALGRTFVFLLTGQEPPELPINLDTGQLIWRDQAKISTGLADLIDDLMAFFPKSRPQNSQIILQHLDNIETTLFSKNSPQKSIQTGNSLRYAGFWKRFIAYLIDTSFITLINAILGLVLLEKTYNLVTNYQEILPIFFGAIVVSALGTIISFLGLILAIIKILSDGYSLNSIHIIIPVIIGLGIFLKWLYFTIMESSAYQGTFGKRILGLQVTNKQGNRISWWRANWRYWMKTVSESSLMLGYLLAIISPKKRALHDWLAGTFVTRHP
jgi:serine/threonine protein kinase